MTDLPLFVQSLLFRVSFHPQISVLKYEENEDLEKVRPYDLLLRWVNFQLMKSGESTIVSNFEEDLKDCKVLCFLLSQISEIDFMTILLTPDPTIRAKQFINKMKETFYPNQICKEEDLLQKNKTELVAFIARLFLWKPTLSKLGKTLKIPVLKEQQTETISFNKNMQGKKKETLDELLTRLNSFKKQSTTVISENYNNLESIDSHIDNILLKVKRFNSKELDGNQISPNLQQEDEIQTTNISNNVDNYINNSITTTNNNTNNSNNEHSYNSNYNTITNDNDDNQNQDDNNNINMNYYLNSSDLFQDVNSSTQEIQNKNQYNSNSQNQNYLNNNQSISISIQSKNNLQEIDPKEETIKNQLLNEKETTINNENNFQQNPPLNEKIRINEPLSNQEYSKKENVIEDDLTFLKRKIEEEEIKIQQLKDKIKLKKDKKILDEEQFQNTSNDQLQLSSFLTLSGNLINETNIFTKIFSQTLQKILNNNKILDDLLLNKSLQLIQQKSKFKKQNYTKKHSIKNMAQAIFLILTTYNYPQLNRRVANLIKEQIFQMDPYDQESLEDTFLNIMVLLKKNPRLDEKSLQLFPILNSLFEYLYFSNNFRLLLIEKLSQIILDFDISGFKIEIENSQIINQIISMNIDEFCCGKIEKEKIILGISEFLKEINFSQHDKFSKGIIKVVSSQSIARTFNYIFQKHKSPNTSLNYKLIRESKINIFKDMINHNNQILGNDLDEIEIEFLTLMFTEETILNSNLQMKESIFHFSESINFTLPLIHSLIYQEIIQANSIENLFEKNNLTTFMVRKYSKKYNKEFLGTTFQTLIQKHYESNLSLEIDPNKISNEENLEDNQNKLRTLFMEYVNTFFTSINNFPIKIKWIYSFLKKEMEYRFPDNTIKIVGTVFFNTYFSDIFLNPENYGFDQALINNENFKKQLELICLLFKIHFKGELFGTDFPHLKFFNNTIRLYFRKRNKFLTQLVVINENEKENENENGIGNKNRNEKENENEIKNGNGNENGNENENEKEKEKVNLEFNPEMLEYSNKNNKNDHNIFPTRFANKLKNHILHLQDQENELNNKNDQLNNKKNEKFFSINSFDSFEQFFLTSKLFFKNSNSINRIIKTIQPKFILNKNNNNNLIIKSNNNNNNNNNNNRNDINSNSIDESRLQMFGIHRDPKISQNNNNINFNNNNTNNNNNNNNNNSGSSSSPTLKNKTSVARLKKLKLFRKKKEIQQEIVLDEKLLQKWKEMSAIRDTKNGEVTIFLDGAKKWEKKIAVLKSNMFALFDIREMNLSFPTHLFLIDQNWRIVLSQPSDYKKKNAIVLSYRGPEKMRIGLATDSMERSKDWIVCFNRAKKI
ncbi:ras gtpase-activating protein [Anaeramoeba flamelloides]|uniref:Ras gtpase-activating protein n=1 Tax=Anaeramoeba flamelloides TaxID=1746091 RepID=A0AAV7ZD30_9EUKA|nr:ras gtpase-activating protein [Anaeramoeba flamelloides]